MAQNFTEITFVFFLCDSVALLKFVHMHRSGRINPPLHGTDSELFRDCSVSCFVSVPCFLFYIASSKNFLSFVNNPGFLEIYLEDLSNSEKFTFTRPTAQAKDGSATPETLPLMYWGIPIIVGNCKISSQASFIPRS